MTHEETKVIEVIGTCAGLERTIDELRADGWRMHSLQWIGHSVVDGGDRWVVVFKRT